MLKLKLLSVVLSVVLSNCVFDSEKEKSSNASGVNYRFILSMEKQKEDGYIIGNKFYVITDLHIDKEYEQKFTDKIEKTLSYGTVLTCGDLTQNGEKEEFKKLKYLVSKSRNKMLFCIGNRDVLVNDELFIKRLSPSVYKKETQYTAIIVLDTADYHLGSLQKEWFINQLKSIKEKNIIVLSHTEDEENFIKINCIKYGVDLVLFGHSHDLNIERMDNTTFMKIDSIMDNKFNLLSIEEKESFVNYTLNNI